MYSTFLCALFPGLGDFMRNFLCAPFTLSIPFTSLSLSPLYPIHLSIPFTSLSLSPLYPFHLSINFTSLSLSLLSLPPSLYLSFYLTLSLSASLSLLSIILFGVSNGRFRPCYIVIQLTSTQGRTRSYLNLYLVIHLWLENIKTLVK